MTAHAHLAAVALARVVLIDESKRAPPSPEPRLQLALQRPVRHHELLVLLGIPIVGAPDVLLDHDGGVVSLLNIALGPWRRDGGQPSRRRRRCDLGGGGVAPCVAPVIVMEVSFAIYWRGGSGRSPPLGWSLVGRPRSHCVRPRHTPYDLHRPAIEVGFRCTCMGSSLRAACMCFHHRSLCQPRLNPLLARAHETWRTR